jgi:hypothetical protein
MQGMSERRIAELESALKQATERAEFWENEARALQRSMLDEKTAQGLLNQARAAALYYGEHHDLCEVPEFASKVYPTCTCGFSDFLTGFPINKYCAVTLGIALQHLRWGDDVRRLQEISKELEALKPDDVAGRAAIIEKYGLTPKATP